MAFFFPDGLGVFGLGGFKGFRDFNCLGGLGL